MRLSLCTSAYTRPTTCHVTRWQCLLRLKFQLAYINIKLDKKSTFKKIVLLNLKLITHFPTIGMVILHVGKLRTFPLISFIFWSQNLWFDWLAGWLTDFWFGLWVSFLFTFSLCIHWFILSVNIVFTFPNHCTHCSSFFMVASFLFFISRSRNGFFFKVFSLQTYHRKQDDIKAATATKCVPECLLLREKNSIL